MALKIDKNVPIPTGVNQRSENAETAARMRPGNSVLFKTAKEAAKFKGALAYQNRGKPYGTAQRPVKGGVRVWLKAKKTGPRRKRGK